MRPRLLRSELALELRLLLRREAPVHQEVHEPAADAALVLALLGRELQEQELRRAVGLLREVEEPGRGQVVVVQGLLRGQRRRLADERDRGPVREGYR